MCAPALCFLAVCVFGAPPASAAPLDVPYNFLDGVLAELATPGGSLPGTNDPECELSSQHPRPVILLHGTGGGRQTNWVTLAPTLVNEGYCVYAPTYGALGGVWPVSALGGLDDKRRALDDVDAFIASVRATTGADQVDIVGHSLGTEIGAYWTRYRADPGSVGTVVSLAPRWRPADAGDGFSRRLRSPSPYVAGVRYTNIVTRYDTIVTPYTVGLLDGPPGVQVTDIVVQQSCSRDRSDHMSITSNRRTAAMVLNALDPAHPRPVPCVRVDPITGG